MVHHMDHDDGSSMVMVMVQGFSFHIYWHYGDTEKIVERLQGLYKIVKSLPSHLQKPLYITEYGVQGTQANKSVPEPGYYKNIPIERTNINAFQHAWFTILSAKLGFVGLSKWDAYFAMYDKTPLYYSLNGPPPKSELWPMYYMMRMFTHTVSPGWTIVTSDDGGMGSADTQLTAMFKGTHDSVMTIV